MNDPFVNRFAAPFPPTGDGILTGTTCAVKDLFAVAGHRTANGNPTIAQQTPVATQDAWVVATLRAAGASLTGITHMDELALSLNGINPHHGPTENPRYPGHITGGSSSGSAAAVAAGDVTFALGSDTGGSLRLPASFCGLYTLRPTHGRIDMTGVQPLAPSLDTPGVFTRDGALLGTIMRLLLTTPAQTASVRRVLTPTDLLTLCDLPLANEAVRFATTIATALGVPHEEAPFGVAQHVLKRTFLTTLGNEAADTHHKVLTGHRHAVSAPTLRVLEHGASLDSKRIAAAAADRTAITDTARNQLAGTLMVLPAAPCLPPPVDAPNDVMHDMNARAVTLHALGSLTGVPCLVIPRPLGADTAGIMLIGAHNTDEALLALAEQLP